MAFCPEDAVLVVDCYRADFCYSLGVKEVEESISPAKSVCLIRVLDQMHVVGVTSANISYIATLDEDEVTLVDQWLENELILERRVKNGFQSFLRNFVRKTGK